MSERDDQQPEHPEEHGRRPDEGAIESSEGLQQPRPSVWIGCLAAYNNGRLHGEWVNAAVEGEEMVEAARRILATSPEPGAEEWAIFDDDEFGAFKVGEFESLETVARVARGIAAHGEAFAAWAQLHDADPDMLEQFEDACLGEYESEEEWAREVMDDIGLETFLKTGPLPETIRPYIRVDYAAWARDAMLSGDVHFESTEKGTVYVFLVR